MQHLLAIAKQQLEESARTKEALMSICDEMVALATAISRCLANNGKVLLCGNGGSAADAQHIAAELVGKLDRHRRALPAIALTTNTSILTAIANDISFDDVFARQVEAFVNAGDILIAISTSGNSENVIRAVQRANEKKAHTVAWTGEAGGRLAQLAQSCLRVPSNNTQRIQEGHITIGHIVCSLLEDLLDEIAPARQQHVNITE